MRIRSRGSIDRLASNAREAFVVETSISTKVRLQGHIFVKEVVQKALSCDIVCLHISTGADISLRRARGTSRVGFLDYKQFWVRYVTLLVHNSWNLVESSKKCFSLVARTIICKGPGNHSL
ncbi:hypothetical protein RRF57_013108 [Xylaria bambusicola]|uniref:Uncharacterized protein n=1 Tax=Xylaria bambusicola TaxID=326684 RepID=A0AAN7ZBG0_9PEZI